MTFTWNLHNNSNIIASCCLILCNGPLDLSSLLLFCSFFALQLCLSPGCHHLSCGPHQHPFHGFHASHLPFSNHCHVTPRVIFLSANLIMLIHYLKSVNGSLSSYKKLNCLNFMVYWVFCADVCSSLMLLQYQNICCPDLPATWLSPHTSFSCSALKHHSPSIYLPFHT